MKDKINILNELREVGAVSLMNTDNKNHFFVPVDYFNNLSSDILTHVYINALPSANPYTVSDTYFENLPGIILDKIDILKNIPVLSSDQKMYAVPDGYFNNLADNILKKIKGTGSNAVQQELEEISPLINSILKQNVYAVPENYFNQLDATTLVTNKNVQAAKVISLSSRTRKWINYAAAACVTVILFGGGYLYFFNKNKQVNSSISSLAKVNVQKEISGLSDDEIENYLKDNSNIAVYTNAGIDDDHQQSMDIQNLLQNVSDDEIQHYLIENSDMNKPKEGI